MLTINDAQFRVVKIDEETGEIYPITYHHYKSTVMFDYDITRTMDGHYDVEMKIDGEWVPYE